MRAHSATQQPPTLPQLFISKSAAPGSTRIEIYLPRRCFLRAKCAQSIVNVAHETAKSVAYGVHNFNTMPSSLLAAEKEEAKAVLALFLRRQGLSSLVATRTINKSKRFIDHLVSRLHLVFKTRYLVGRELTTLEIRDSLVPYLESLLTEHGENLVDVVESFPHAPGNIKGMTRKFPAFAYYSLEGKIKPVVEFLLDLGIPLSDIPIILYKRPQLCGVSLTENLVPTMNYLENLGVDKRQWAKVIHRFPAFLTYSRQKVKGTVDYLHRVGLSAGSIGKILTRCPHIISYSVDENLHPTVEYFRSLGVDVAVLLYRSPQTFGLSIETNLKPVTEFFLERGYSVAEIGTMVSRYGALYTFSLTENMIPKWDFFLTTGYRRSELVKFPQYFGYSLEDRIKPRYAQVKQSGVKMCLNQILSISDSDFEKNLQKKIERRSNRLGLGSVQTVQCNDSLNEAWQVLEH
ncbi:hypothetical protein Syun_024449 [Stephania yunnanensis]|uniref:Transcription termination factor MTERF5, chloroplastic n=1 Tax=Stephania yunnanensis TaxID=152371 RepID=A0AAP0I4F6_9MAGN